jgi:hypothetical protein
MSWKINELQEQVPLLAPYLFIRKNSPGYKFTGYGKHKPVMVFW